MMSPFDLLPLDIKKIVYDLGWQQLTKIQAAAIENILKTNYNYILCSKTASGKTEAVFLPILSKLDRHKMICGGVNVLYVSPLIALINDQFERLDKLCNCLNIKVTKWHGEVSRSVKKKLALTPEGILLITPESLESIFVNKPDQIRSLFSNLEFIVIDEIHSFLNTKRGTQLRSLIFRLQEKIRKKIRFFALSATLGDFDNVKNFTCDYDNTKVLLDRSKKLVDAKFKYFHSDSFSIPIELIYDLQGEINNKKSLVFPNSRAKVEEISVKLKRISKEAGTHQNYFAHHSSVSRDLRHFAEKYAKENFHKCFSIVCTSTLELGIDIGSVDLICQINSTFSVSSLAQRFGRCGRKEGMKSNLLLYATNEWFLLQALACFELYNESVLEPLEPIRYPLDLVIHQILSILKETHGINKGLLLKKIKSNFAFNLIPEGDLIFLVENLISEKYIEILQDELILGLKAEFFFRKADFYAVFETEKTYKVFHKEKLIGELQDVSENMIGENFYLSAQIWKIVGIDFRIRKVFVSPASDGKEPNYYSSLPDIHEIIRGKMLQILYANESYDYLDTESINVLSALVNYFSLFKIKNLCTERPVAIIENKCHFYTFTSSKINLTLQLLAAIKNIDCRLMEYKSCIVIGENLTELKKILEGFIVIINDFDLYFEKFLDNNPQYFDNLGKWEKLLPMKLKTKMWIENYLDIRGTKKLLENVSLINS